MDLIFYGFLVQFAGGNKTYAVPKQQPVDRPAQTEDKTRRSAPEMMMPSRAEEARAAPKQDQRIDVSALYWKEMFHSQSFVMGTKLLISFYRPFYLFLIEYLRHEVQGGSST